MDLEQAAWVLEGRAIDGSSSCPAPPSNPQHWHRFRLVSHAAVPCCAVLWLQGPSAHVRGPSGAAGRWRGGSRGGVSAATAGGCQRQRRQWQRARSAAGDVGRRHWRGCWMLLTSLPNRAGRTGAAAAPAKQPAEPGAAAGAALGAAGAAYAPPVSFRLHAAVSQPEGGSWRCSGGGCILSRRRWRLHADAFWRRQFATALDRGKLPRRPALAQPELGLGRQAGLWLSGPGCCSIPCCG